MYYIIIANCVSVYLFGVNQFAVIYILQLSIPNCGKYQIVLARSNEATRTNTRRYCETFRQFLLGLLTDKFQFNIISDENSSLSYFPV